MAHYQKKHSIIFHKGCILFGWLVLWQLAAKIVSNHILLVGPVETLTAAIGLVHKLSFWKIILYSMTRILSGFFLGLAMGVLLAVCSAKYAIIEQICSPVITLIKAIPVASFVVLFLIWWHADKLSVIISFMVVFPNIYLQTIEGIRNVDKKLLEMAKVFHMPLKNRIFYLYRPACKTFLDSAMKISIGMSWKSGVAAEVIGTPDYSIGESLYMAKIYLETADVLAWTAIIIFLCAICEKIIIYAWEAFCNWKPHCKINAMSCNEDDRELVSIHNLTKNFELHEVIQDYSAIFLRGEIYKFQSPSGSGKTTLFRLITGLEKSDGGEILTKSDIFGYQFQEDRLCEEYNALINVGLVSSKPDMIREMLLELLPEEAIELPCKELSGGMKRRVALVRAFSTDSPIIVLDEPFTGLDEKNIEKVKQFIKKYGENKCILLATHI